MYLPPLNPLVAYYETMYALEVHSTSSDNEGSLVFQRSIKSSINVSSMAIAEYRNLLSCYHDKLSSVEIFHA